MADYKFKAPTSIEDLREYVEAFRASSNRTRFALYVVVTASSLIGIATRNVHPSGWSFLRLKKWYTTPLSELSKHYPDTVAFKILREEYTKQFAARAVMPSSPIPGGSFDVNELGLIGGIALVLLMLVLVFCIFREYENLQLALYKVRQLCAEEGPAHVRADSRANLLYHALAMGQVLSSPPTLARWHKRGLLSHFGFLYFVPVVVQGWVLFNNWTTRGVAEWFGINVNVNLAWQAGITITLALLSGTAWIVSRGMALRWKRAFLRVNPARDVAPQMTLRQWLKIPNPLGKITETHGLIVRLVDSLSVTDSAERTAQISVNHTLLIKGRKRSKIRKAISKRINPVRRQLGELPRIPLEKAKEMALDLREKGLEAARDWCDQDSRGKFVELREFEASRNEYLRYSADPPTAEWTVEGIWSFAYRPGGPAKPADHQDPSPALKSRPPADPDTVGTASQSAPPGESHKPHWQSELTAAPA